MIAHPKPIRVPRVRKPLRRQSRPRRERKTTIGALRRKLWGLFAAYVKERDGDRCITCGASGLEARNRHAGHFIRKDGHSSVAFDPKNVHVQCGACNLWARGNVHAYAEAIIDRYGIAEFRRLVGRSREVKQWTKPELRELIEALQHSPEAYECLYYERYL